MLIGKVTGSLWSTRKHEQLNGMTFLIVAVITDEQTSAKRSLVAADIVGAGLDDLVLVTEGSAARAGAENEQVPVDAMIIGIIDSVDRGAAHTNNITNQEGNNEY
ncbi:EutN/CcmL family microcompartment protein [Brochothrix campestris]|uniref:Ethanolamine utilization EutN/carboxysome structural Ccml family protein n=1 Tax=Brochothrix campestris FSL F6-1037 TaxID=1265861 RepID=W7CJ42_9LIST|nr:EutN/CcmL family microcompartment protein [Brochothrix campestris]EUJ36992.1 ethanolamine utilization EutN/carboxysome structural Ccml family protein [Brochothrix campestris FSL F6-1037]